MFHRLVNADSSHHAKLYMLEVHSNKKTINKAREADGEEVSKHDPQLMSEAKTTMNDVFVRTSIQALNSALITAKTFSESRENHSSE